jgi:hypothetical protein
MQEKHLFEYATIRIVPRVEREEFLNVGVVLYCAKKRFLQCKFHLNSNKLKVFYCEDEVPEYEKHLLAFQQICEGSANSGQIGKLDIPSRFRWLTAMRSTVIQTSRVHPGFCDDPQQTLDKLFQELVL